MGEYDNSSSSGPRGSISAFFIGLILIGIGGFMVFNNTTISTGFSLFGYKPNFGLVLLPLLIGIIMLFFNTKSIIGWILVILGLAIIILGILMGLRVYFHRVSLFEGIIMFGSIAAGIGCTLRGLYAK